MREGVENKKQLQVLWVTKQSHVVNLIISWTKNYDFNNPGRRQPVHMKRNWKTQRCWTLTNKQIDWRTCWLTAGLTRKASLLFSNSAHTNPHTTTLMISRRLSSGPWTPEIAGGNCEVEVREETDFQFGASNNGSCQVTWLACLWLAYFLTLLRPYNYQSTGVNLWRGLLGHSLQVPGHPHTPTRRELYPWLKVNISEYGLQPKCDFGCSWACKGPQKVRGNDSCTYLLTRNISSTVNTYASLKSAYLIERTPARSRCRSNTHACLLNGLTTQVCHEVMREPVNVPDF